MNMLDPKFTDNFLEGLKGSFRFVGKNHLKGAWAYWLLGVTVAFAGTMIYIANLNGQFMQSQGAADSYETITNSDELTADYHVAVASGEQSNLIRWDPEYTRIPKESVMGEVMMAAAVVVGMFAPVILPAVGVTGSISGAVATGISTATGISVETVSAVLTIVRGVSTVSNVVGVIVPDVTYSIPTALNWGALGTNGLPTKSYPISKEKMATPSTTTKTVKKGVTLPDVNSVKIGNRATAEINKRANASIKKLDTLVCGRPLSELVRDNDQTINAKSLYSQIRDIANEKINDFKSGKINGRTNEVRAIFTIAGVSGSAIEAISSMDKLLFTNKIIKQRCPTGDSTLMETDSIAPVRALMAQKEAVVKINTIVKNELGVVGKTSAELFDRTDGRNVLEFERAGVKNATILTGIGDDPLPGSQWIGFRNGDVAGKAAQDNTIMVATDSFVLTAIPNRVFLGVRSTDTPIEVRLNGVSANTLKAKVNTKNTPPYKTNLFELGHLVGIGTNRLGVAIAQSAGARLKFALSYVLYVVCEPGVQCLGTAN